MQENGDEYGCNVDYDSVIDYNEIDAVYVFLPVEPFSITGYRTKGK